MIELKDLWHSLRTELKWWDALLIMLSALTTWLWLRGRVHIARIGQLKMIEDILNTCRDKMNLCMIGLYRNEFNADIDATPPPDKGYCVMVAEQVHPYQPKANENEFFLGPDAILLIQEAGKHDIVTKAVDPERPKGNEVETSIASRFKDPQWHITLRIATRNQGREVITLFAVADKHSYVSDKYIDYLRFEARRKLSVALRVKYTGKKYFTLRG